MKRIVLYWKTNNIKRIEEVKEELSITSESVNRESDYKGSLDRLEPYIKEGLIVVRVKDEQEIRRKKVCLDTIESKPINRKKVGCGGRKRKV